MNMSEKLETKQYLGMPLPFSEEAKYRWEPTAQWGDGGWYLQTVPEWHDAMDCEEPIETCLHEGDWVIKSPAGFSVVSNFVYQMLTKGNPSRSSYARSDS